MRLGEIFRFEVRYRLRRFSTWLYFGILFALAFLSLHAIEGGSGQANAPTIVAIFMVLFGILGGLVTAALLGDAATRDVQSGIDPLFYTAPINKTEYLGGRFLGNLAVNALLLVAVPLGLAVGAQMPYLSPEMFGPFRAMAYVQPYLFFLLPNLVLTASVLFTVAALSRKMLPTFLAGIAIFFGYVLADEVYDRMEAREAAALLDPFGLNALNDLTAYWTPIEQNTRLVPLDEVLIWNRVLWLAVAVGVLAFLHLRFRFAHTRGGTRRKREDRPEVAHAGVERNGALVVPPVSRSFGLSTRARQTLAVARRSVSEVVANSTFLTILAGALFWVFFSGWDVGGIVFGTSAWPVTHLVAGTILSGPFAISVVISLLTALYAGELVWSERDARLSEIADVAPVPDWVPFLGKFLALVLMLVSLQVVLLAAGVLLQVLRGYHHLEIGLYLQILFGMRLPDYILLATLAMLVHVMVGQKYLGHLIVVLFYLFTHFAGHFGIEHNLLVYGSDPGWVYSDMSGFGPFLGPFVWFKLYWAAWALLLAVAANLLWVRGREQGARRRLRLARTRLGGVTVGATTVAAVLIVALGGFVFYNTNVLNEYRTGSEQAGWQAEYERRYKKHEDTPQPLVIGSDLHIEIYPEQRVVELRGTYRLRNRTAEAIDSVHLSVDPDVRIRSFAFDRPATHVLDDERLQYHVYALERPLQPGDSLRLIFDLVVRPRGFPNSGIETQVVGNGTYFERLWLPIVGYQPELELSGEKVRREHGLEPRAPLPPIDDSEARRYGFSLRDAEWVDFQAVIGTAEDQIAVAPGSLQREWRENGRRYFHYRTDAPIPNHYPILSAEYEVLEDRWNDVAIEILHHPTHTFNLERIVRSIKASLAYHTEHFGPYPHRQIRVVEFPRHAGGYARSLPNTIVFSEGNSFLTRVGEGDIDRPFFVTAHEMGHQWWGNQLVSANVHGAAVLSETLAQYGAIMVMEKTYGRDEVRRFLRYEMDGYLRGRRVYGSKEVPLLFTAGQSYIHYHKGAVAMYALREHIGEERVNAALRRILEAHRFAGPPYPTSLDLYDALREATPDSLRGLLADFFEHVTLWDLRTLQVRVDSVGPREYRVTLDVQATKVRVDSLGGEREVPMDDRIEIGVFAPAADGKASGEPLYLQRHRIRSGTQSITVTVPRRPAQAGIDPGHERIDRQLDDNMAVVDAGG